ncbi:carbohydrate ABC transporter permease [Microbacterium sp. CFBP9034]|uniref:carbohydrate ABC transporter permease n=1 Tax=Microbacterium sp. CFBP9034 TaxID=3096540 RepID=UPI002A698EA0|nr:carbohydrate ABC transporter permease [Microbacterium sp. CFBP9034]MDY0908829.1 carbohydrate ABC transporter permease [Microbacterium sp. CFBP9034]
MIGRRRGSASALLVIAAVVCWAPIWFMVIVATRDSATATTFPPPLLPGGDLSANLERVLATVSFSRAVLNSVLAAACVAVGGALLCALAGYAFAKLRFPGRHVLFAVVLVGLTLPAQLAVIPSYLLVSALGWVDSLSAVIVPGLASAFGVFWMSQHIAAALPDELLAAASLDGCGPGRAFWHVALPLVRPGAAVLAGILFVSTWSDFMWPFIVLRSPDSQTIQVALSALQSEYGVDYALVFAGALLATAPVVLLAALGGRWMTRGLIPRPANRGARTALSSPQGR